MTLPGPSVVHVFLAGVGNSGPDHWQRIWYEDLRARVPSVWVGHDDWERVAFAPWLGDLDDAMEAVAAPLPVVLVAHSLGCLLGAEWLARHRERPAVRAFFVAPPDAEGPGFPKDVTGFRRGVAIGTVGHPATLVASRDDPYGTFAHALDLAKAWGATFVDAGSKGHLNATSSLGAWSEGRALLRELLERPVGA